MFFKYREGFAETGPLSAISTQRGIDCSAFFGPIVGIVVFVRFGVDVGIRFDSSLRLNEAAGAISECASTRLNQARTIFICACHVFEHVRCEFEFPTLSAAFFS